MKKQAGFTMIELIIVVVILGILAATALPRFIDFSSDASRAAVQGVAGGLSAASAVNYAGRALGKTVTPTTLVGNATSAVCITTAAGLGGLLSTGWPTSGGVYTAAPSATSAASCVAGGSVTCTITFTPTGGTAVTADAAITCYQ